MRLFRGRQRLEEGLLLFRCLKTIQEYDLAEVEKVVIRVSGKLRPKTRKTKTRKTKTWKTKTRETKTLFFLVLTAILGPFKKRRKNIINKCEGHLE